MPPPIRGAALAVLLAFAACSSSRGVRLDDASLESDEAAVVHSVRPAQDGSPDEAPDDAAGEDAEDPELDAGEIADAEAPPASEQDAAGFELDAEALDAGAGDHDAADDGAAHDAETLQDAAAPQDAEADALLDAADAAPNAGDAEAGLDGAASASEAGVLDPAGDWSCFGKDLAHTRFNAAETHLSKSNVAGLTRLWQQPAPGISATPAVVGDVTYWADWRGSVHALRTGSGAPVWTRSLPNGFTSSPCVSERSVFVADRFNNVYALDRESGATRWATQVNPVALTHLWSSPIVADGVVIVGIAADGTQSDREPLPPEVINTFRGAVVGLDAASGALLWRFETTRVPGEPADRYASGVSVWSSAAVDLARGLLFIGTGNSYGLPASPYSDALLAIRYRSGELAWHVQFTPDDGYSGANPNGGPDYDIGAAPNLFSIAGAAGPRDVVGVGDKGGRYRVFDRDTHALVWETQLEPGFSIARRKTGGVIAPAAVAYGRVFVASNTSWSASKVWALDAQSGAIQWESASIDSVNFGAPAVANGVLFFGGSGFRADVDPPDSLGVGEPGELIAFDVDDGAVLYRTQLYAGRGAGFSIAHGRVFIGSGFTFFGWSDEPLDGALEVFGVP
jgi:polyvinyl alcohol dehydrogenase (cytochrome)